MCLLCRSGRVGPWGSVAVLLLLGLGLACRPEQPREALRVCADPNDLPYSNNQEEGFENRLARLVARDFDATVRYTWWAQRRGFVRNTLNAGSCDVIMGVPAGYEMVLTSTPYYRSSYVFVTRKDRHLAIRSLDDSVLRQQTVGVQLVGDDFANTPPAHALARRGIISNIRGFPVFGDYRQPNPVSPILRAVANGEIDVAIVWGPQAGYFARQSSTPLSIQPLAADPSSPDLPFTFAMAMGVRRGDTLLRARLNHFIEVNQAEIDRLLQSYGVPRVAAPPRTVTLR